MMISISAVYKQCKFIEKSRVMQINRVLYENMREQVYKFLDFYISTLIILKRYLLRLTLCNMNAISNLHRTLSMGK